MNVIVLTPDRVGSSLLQKFITMVMQGYDYGKPVINLHELTNNIVKYHSTKYNQALLGKPAKEEWGYHQSLKEITGLLSSVDQYTVSRLAQYHIVNRKDSLSDQLSFYKYINDNFYIIGARRENLFEHALSWCIVAFSKKLNVYQHEEKIEAFSGLYKNKIAVDLKVFTEYLDKYLNYLKWSSDHFMVNKIFNYETDVKNLDGFVSQLDIFPNNHPAKKWEDTYGISWNKWNACHYLISDLTNFSLKLADQQEFKLLENEVNPQLPTNSMGLQKILSRSSLSTQDQEFVKTNFPQYFSVYKTVSQQVADRELIHGVPIKLQTLAEKALMVKNFKECIDTYNDWSAKNNLDHRYSVEDLGNIALTELQDWYDNVNR
jgi:hypothetical protein